MFDTWTVDQLERTLVEAEQRIGRLRAMQMALLDELDGAQVARLDGSGNLPEWVAARCDMDVESARAVVCTARTTLDRPELRIPLAEGTQSFARCAVTARLAASGAGPDMIERSAGHDIQAFVIPPGHDGWVVGDGPFETYEWAGALSWIPPVERLDVRTLSLVLTDIAGSTAMANSVGSLTWSELIAIHHERSRDVIATHSGRVEKFTGDGVLASFNGAAAALSCAMALGRMAESLEMTLRTAVHTGEVTSAAGELAGIAIHELARIIEITKPGQILVSETTRLLARTGAFEFTDHGMHDLRSIEGSRTLFALVR